MITWVSGMIGPPSASGSCSRSSAGEGPSRRSPFPKAVGARWGGCSAMPTGSSRSTVVGWTYCWPESWPRPVGRRSGSTAPDTGTPKMGMEGSGPESHLAEAADAVRVLVEETGVERVGVVGSRFGATVAALLAERLELPAAILIGPVVAGRAYAAGLVRAVLVKRAVSGGSEQAETGDPVETLEREGELDVNGFPLSREAHRAFQQIDLMKDIDPIPGIGPDPFAEPGRGAGRPSRPAGRASRRARCRRDAGGRGGSVRRASSAITGGGRSRADAARRTCSSSWTRSSPAGPGMGAGRAAAMVDAVTEYPAVRPVRRRVPGRDADRAGRGRTPGAGPAAHGDRRAPEPPVPALDPSRSRAGGGRGRVDPDGVRRDRGQHRPDAPAEGGGHQGRPGDGGGRVRPAVHRPRSRDRGRELLRAAW